METAQTRAIWAMFYANLMAMDRHPGNKDNKQGIRICADLADLMLEEYLKRFEHTQEY